MYKTPSFPVENHLLLNFPKPKLYNALSNKKVFFFF